MQNQCRPMVGQQLKKEINMAHMKRHAAWVLALGLGMASGAQANLAMATQYGCTNCHGAQPRGEAPGFERLAGKLAKYKGDDAALVQKVAKYRTGAPLEHIDAHERISAETATALLRWLADGAK